MNSLRDFPTITSEDLMGLDFRSHPAELPIRTIFGHPAAIFSRGLPYAVYMGIARAVMDLGYRYGVTGAEIVMGQEYKEIKEEVNGMWGVRQRLFPKFTIKITYRGTHAQT